MPSTAITSGLRASAPAGARAGERRAPRAGRRAAASSHRSCSSGDSGSGNDSATGPGPNTVPRRRRQRRDRAGLQQVRARRRRRRPTRRPAVRRTSAPRRRRGGPAGAGRRRRADASPGRADLADPATPVEHAGPPVDLARHELVRARRRRRRRRGGRGGRRPGRRRTAPRPSAACEHRLDEDRHVGVDEPGVAGAGRPSASTPSMAATQRGLAGDVEDRVEDAGHRRPVAVLAGRRRAHDDGQRAVGGHVAPGVDGARRGRRRVQAVVSTTPGRAGRPAARARARFAALAPTSVGTTGGRVVERDDCWGRDGVHGTTRSRGAL